MSQGRKRYTDRPVVWKVSIPQSIAAPLDLLLTDPVTGKPKHGARAKLITGLLVDYLYTRRLAVPSKLSPAVPPKELDN